MIKLKIGEPEPTCGAPSSTSKKAMRCELPPSHHAPGTDFGPYHYGRNRIGSWRAWLEREKARPLD